MELDDRFATRADSVDEVPEPFRSALLPHPLGEDAPRLLVFNPSHKGPGGRSPATLLAVTGRRWLLASDDADGRCAVAACGFDDTVLVELTKILLYGQLKIHFVDGGVPHACDVEFNTVMDGLYREAVHLILAGVEGESAAAPLQEAAGLPLEGWPLKFRNSVSRSLPEGRRALRATHWPAVYGGFRRELAPAAALLATDRELVLIAEEQAWARGPRQAKYGSVVTYFPLVRLAQVGFRRHNRFTELSLEMHALHGGETLTVLFPPDHQPAVAQVVECALRLPSTAGCHECST